MPTPFTRPEFARLTQILESLNECIDANAQRQLITRAFRFLSRGNEIVGRLQYSPSAHTFVVGLIDDLDNRYTQSNKQTTLAVLIQHVADDVLVEGDDADFLRGLLGNHFGVTSVAPPTPSTPSTLSTPSPAPPPIEIVTELTQIRELLAQMRADDRASTNEILAAISQRMIAESEANELATALRSLALRALGEVQASNTQLRAQLTKLSVEHQGSATGYLSASIPLIPGILQCSLELGTQHTLDLKAIVDRIRAKIGMKGAKQVRLDDVPRGKIFVPGQMRGIFVGVNHYEDSGISRLNMAVKDVTALSKMLAPSYRSVALLTDDTPTLPTRENILAQLAATVGAAEEGDLILFYFSGHGIEEKGEGYLLPRNARYNILSDTAVPVARVCEILNSKDCKARAKILILDACHSGAQFGKSVEKMTQALIERVYTQAEGMAVIASCRQDEVSWEAPELGQGVFTYYLLEALSGQADFDGKGFVSVNDAYRYVNNSVKAWAEPQHKTQRPTIKLEADGDMILMRYS